MSADVLTPLQNFAEEEEYNVDSILQVNNIFGDDFGVESSRDDNDGLEDSNNNNDKSTTIEEEEEETLSVTSVSNNDVDNDVDNDVGNDVNNDVNNDVDEDNSQMVNTDIDTPNTSNNSGGGLENLGNTCYLNSAIQMLSSSDSFIAALESQLPSSEDSMKLKLRSEFLTLVHDLHHNDHAANPENFKEAIDEISSLFVGYRQQDSHEFLTTVLELLDESYQQPPKEEEKNNEEEVEIETSVSSPDPLKRVSSLAELKVDEISTLLHGHTTSTTMEKKEMRSMEDSTRSEHKKCKLIGGRAVITSTEASSTIRKEDESCCFVCKEESTNTTSNERQQQQHEDSIISSSSSPVDTHFGTEVRSRLTCDSCKYTRSKIEKYLFLSIDIQDPEDNTVEEGLRCFFAPEKLDLKCEKCFCETAVQTTEITRLPKALLLHFKRFIVDVSPDYSTITYCKNKSKVTFPKQLSCGGIHDVLTEFLAEDLVHYNNDTMSNDDDEDENQTTTYNIRSIVNHIGSSASCGHYTADSCRPTATSNENNNERHDMEWTRFNDAIVTDISPEEAVSETTAKTAYIVMYEQEEEKEDDIQLNCLNSNVMKWV